MTLKKSDILLLSQRLSGSFQELTLRKKKKNKDEVGSRIFATRRYAAPLCPPHADKN
jgi:hypothetical protein